MAKFTVRFGALTDMIAKIEVDAPSAEDAVLVAQGLLEPEMFELPDGGAAALDGTELPISVDDEHDDEILAFDNPEPSNAVRAAVEVVPGWPQMLADLAEREGWALQVGAAGIAVVALEGAGGFAGPSADEQAAAHVARFAELGSALHEKALEAGRVELALYAAASPAP